MRDFLFIFLQRIVPQHLISKIIGSFAASKNKKIKNIFISFFINKYEINMKEALEENPLDYQSFNAFFTRRLKPGIRNFSKDKNCISSPVDGEISQIGSIKTGKLFQAKGRLFSLLEFLGGEEDLEKKFFDGEFATIYLSPKDYHRIHMPFSGRLKSMNYIPGDLFSVNPVTVDSVDNLFSRNERLSCIFETEKGYMAVVLVGAMIVSGIRVSWGTFNFKINRTIQRWDYPRTGEGSVFLKKGVELGQFFLGSTVVLCFPNNQVRWVDGLNQSSVVRLGQTLANYR